MAEIKHTFQAGKMNKDLDERLVPQGEYRDALNIEVRTSDGSDVGAVQNLYGNIERETYNSSYPINPTEDRYGIKSTFIGSIANEKTNKAYFFVACPPITPEVKTGYMPLINSVKVFKDMILEYDNITNKINPVVTDIFRIEYPRTVVTGTDINPVTTSYFSNDTGSLTTLYNYITLLNTDIISQVRVGMSLRALDANGGNVFKNSESQNINPEIIKIDGLKIYLNQYVTGDLTTVSAFILEADNVLNFYRHDNTERRLITGINIIDDLLFWTDNKTEPKKINITRCKEGTKNSSGQSVFDHHTDLMISNPNVANTLIKVSDIPGSTDLSHLKEEHITVIRKSPKTAPNLMMSENEDGQDGSAIGTCEIDQTAEGASLFDADGVLLSSGDTTKLGIEGENNYGQGQILTFTCNNVVGESVSFTALIDEVIDSVTFIMQIQSINVGITSEHTTFKVKIQQRKPLFELDFGRFAYRYKYQDGEYSSFSPWSELAFIPGDFDYIPKKGYNLGMVNNLRYLVIKDFIAEDDQRPDDVVEVDVLYKDTVSPNCYIVKSIKRSDEEWNNTLQYSNNLATSTKGALRITSEMIHRTLPSNQILRAWDNVPRVARAQEVTGNRIVYGNYLQNYDISSFSTVIQSYESTDNNSAEDGYYKPMKSVKSIRDYKIGVVFGDEYGRETPIVGMSGSLSGSKDNTTNAGVNIDKKLAPKANRLTSKIQFKNNNIPNWVEYYKFYVKETSNEYYNLAMDRWYNAEDGNIWLSFQSADRNKLDMETYLILKNQHGSNDPVIEDARYKILAIENEAPDFIKSTEKIIGVEIIDEEFNSTAAIADAAYVSFTGGQWQRLFGDAMEIPGHSFFKGEGFARIRGVEGSVVRYSEWVAISSVNPVEKKITTVDSFGPSADFSVIYNTTPDEFAIEIKDSVVENRPEFDGRFFVKVFKDPTLERNVLVTTSPSTTFNIVDVLKCYHISSTKWNQADINAEYQGNYEYKHIDELTNPTGIPTKSHGWTNAVNYTYSNGAANVDGYGATNDANKSRWYHKPTSTNYGYNYHGDLVHGLSYKCTHDHIEDTQIFWTKYRTYHQNMSDKPSWFLDGVTTTDDNGNANSGPNPNPFFNNNENITKYNGMMFGRVGGGESGISSDQLKFVKALSAGTLFRFAADPMQTIYQVVKNNGGGGLGTQGLYNGPYKKSGDNCDISIPSHYLHSRRARLYINFHVYNNPNLGLDTGIWDPRSAVRHDVSNLNPDGTAAMDELKIEILTPVYEDEQSVETAQGNAVWETEPKEDVGLDLYYEATTALPIKLKESNNESFAPAGSIVDLFDNNDTRKLSLLYDLNSTSSDPRLVVAHIYRDVLAVKGFSREYPYPFYMKINDNLSFTHSSGMITRSSIVDHWYPLTSSDGDYKKSLRYTYNVTFPDLATSSTQQYGVINNAASDFNVSEKTIGSYEYNPVWEVTSPQWDNETKRIFVVRMNVIGSKTFVYFVQTKPTSTLLNESESLSFDELNSELGISIGGTYEMTFTEITGYVKIDDNVYDNKVVLPWFNCYSFGNGLESDRIRDDFNAPTIDNGVKVSTGLDTYGEERRSSGMIYSGIYNSTSGINELNEFNMAESITKDLNPMYGSIQALKTRDTNVVAFCEDKVFKILANKDALYNADGSMNVTASNAVLGNAIGFSGDYGISTNPESLAVDGYRMYFTDKQRNKVLRLSQDGLTPISDVGMRSWFRDHLKHTHDLIGSFDEIKGEYNLSLTHTPSYIAFNERTGQAELVPANSTNTTVSFNEASKGWSSFKSFIPETALSINDEYLTGKDAKLWSHHSETLASTGPNLIANGTFETANGWQAGYNDSTQQVTNDYALKMTSSSYANELSRVEAVGRKGKSYKISHELYDLEGVGQNVRIRLVLNGTTTPPADNNDPQFLFGEGVSGTLQESTFVAYQDFDHIHYIAGTLDCSITVNNVSLVEVFDEPRKIANVFYGVQYNSTIDVLFNEMPGSVKSFNTINYEGSQAKVTEFISESTTDAAGNVLSLTDGEYYNLSSKDGWYVDSFTTDLQEGEVAEFRNKENKWFNNITGVSTELSNLDTSEFSVQGIGVGTYDKADVSTVTLTIQENND